MKVRQTDSGAWWPCEDMDGALIREDVPPHGYETKREAQEEAARRVSRELNADVSPSQISEYTPRSER